MRISDWSSDVCSSDLHRAASGILLPWAALRGKASGSRQSTARIQVRADELSPAIVAARPATTTGPILPDAVRWRDPGSGAPHTPGGGPLIPLMNSCFVLQKQPFGAVLPHESRALPGDRKSTRLNSSH